MAARPLRLEFPGVLYHITARGNCRESIYQDDQDHLGTDLDLPDYSQLSAKVASR